MSKKWSASATYLFLCAGISFAFTTVVTVNLIYQAETVGLNPLQLVLVGTVLEAAVFIGEIPTGIVADIYSRRLSVVIGLVLTGLGFVIEGSFALFSTVLLAQVVWGLGFTFISGAKEAWIADEIGEKLAPEMFLRGSQAGHLGALAGIGLSVILASMELRYAVIGGGVLFVLLGLVMAGGMPEAHFSRAKPEDRSSWASMADQLRGGIRVVRQRPTLMTILAVMLLFGMFSESYDRLWTPHLLASFEFPVLWNLQPVVWFGIISAVSLFLSVFAIEGIKRNLDTGNDKIVTRLLVGVHGLILVSVVVFALSSEFAVALAAVWTLGIMRGVMAPLMTIWTNRQIDSPHRATVLSISSQADAIGQIAGGPVLGAIATARTMATALAGGSALLIPIMVLIGVGKFKPAEQETEP